MWPHFFTEASWFLEVHAGGASLDHRSHQLVALSTPPKPASASRRSAK